VFITILICLCGFCRYCCCRERIMDHRKLFKCLNTDIWNRVRLENPVVSQSDKKLRLAMKTAASMHCY
jgi:hypothetical protein